MWGPPSPARERRNRGEGLKVHSEQILRKFREAGQLSEDKALPRWPRSPSEHTFSCWRT